MEGDQSFPVLDQVVLDTTDARALAEFYRKLLGFIYRAGDEPPSGGETDARGHDWLVVHHPSGFPRVAFQQVTTLRRSTWPGDEVPQQLHLDKQIGSVTAGKNADLVVLKGDPSKQISDIENVEIVFKDGIGYDSRKLLDSVRGRYGQY